MDVRSKNRRWVHVVSGLAPEAGGPSYSVPALAKACRPYADTVDLWTTARAAVASDISIADRTRVFSQSILPILSSLKWSAELANELRSASQACDVIHTHGLWLMPNIYPSWALAMSKDAKAKLVHAPRGMLGVEARKISGWKKEPIWWLWQFKALQAAHCIHATAESEYEEIRQAGLKNPIAIVPNGIDLPNIVHGPKALGRRKRILSLGRIHPKKGLDRLVRAWAQIETQRPDWDLVIVGNAEVRHDVELRNLANSLGVTRLDIKEPVYGDAKWLEYTSSDLFVLPTLNENFALTVAEALACGVPVISTKGAPWGGLEVEGCGWWIDHGVDQMAATLRHATALPTQERMAMGKLGKLWMARDFSWSSIGAEMANVYGWLHGTTYKPDCVYLT